MAAIIARLTSNPLLVKEMRRPTKLVSRTALKFGFGAGLALTIFSVVFFLITHEISLILLIAALYCLIVFSIPPFVAYTAAISTVNDMQPEQYDLLQMTSISNERLIEGYILTTLYRCRGFFAVVLGLVPFAIIWGIYFSVYDVYVYCLRYARPFDTCQLSSPTLIPLALIAFIVLVISVVGVCILSASLGVLFAASSRSRFVSGMAAVIIAVLISGIVTLILIDPPIQTIFQRSLLYVPFPYLVCGLEIFIGSPLARNDF